MLITATGTAVQGGISPLELALIVAAATPVAAVIISFGGTAVRDWRQDKRAVRGARDQTIAELMTAAVDLVVGGRTRAGLLGVSGSW
jgi:hypothetical protein